MGMKAEIETPIGTLVAETNQEGEFYDIFIDLKSGSNKELQVCVVTVDPEGLHIYPYNTTEKDDGCACDDLTVIMDESRWLG